MGQQGAEAARAVSPRLAARRCCSLALSEEGGWSVSKARRPQSKSESPSSRFPLGVTSSASLIKISDRSANKVAASPRPHILPAPKTGGLAGSRSERSVASQTASSRLGRRSTFPVIEWGRIQEIRDEEGGERTPRLGYDGSATGRVGLRRLRRRWMVSRGEDRARRSSSRRPPQAHHRARICGAAGWRGWLGEMRDSSRRRRRR